ncbi:MAG: ABC transporter ATP-binding protein [Thaumarchaeota archaeon]|nr:ABC transporter ATP-binding protein [Nitrososphaerota archaeon]
MNVIETRALAKHFSRVNALSGITFQVQKGAITGLIGPNGAGKTTTMKLLLGLLRPDGGEAFVFEKTPWNNPEVLRKIGVIQERSRFPQNMKTEDYLSRIARMYGYVASRGRQVLKEQGLEAALDRPIGKLSAGMQQRFALAHALIHEPELVIADEPTSNLDPQGRNDVLSRVLQANKETGTTFLISSHLLPELSRICDTAAIMSAGKIMASGDLQKLYTTFRSQMVRVSTDKPHELSERIKLLKYVTGVELSGENISVETEEGLGKQLYFEVPKLASEVGAELYGIESKGASLEELFRRAVSSDSS